MRIRKKPGKIWTTKDEFKFLSGLGTFSEHEGINSRSELLSAYISASENREYWEKIDFRKTVSFAKKELEKEGQNEIKML